MHKRNPDFNPLKFTPSRIANKKSLPEDELKKYFTDHTLKECASRYGCSIVTIKRTLRRLGVDTSVHNNSALAMTKYKESVKGKAKPTADELKSLYIDQNLDSKSIAEIYGLHYNTVRSLIRKLLLTKTRKSVAHSMSNRHFLKYGLKHPAQRQDVRKKTSISLNKASYKGYDYKSITELGYALYLDKLGREWYYEEMTIPYIDMMTGKRRLYIIDFTVVLADKVSWIEVKPNNEMIPEDKRIYALRRAEESNIEYRGLNDQEREGLWQCITDGYNFSEVKFTYRTPRSTSHKITYYFKSKYEASEYKLDGWKEFTEPSNIGALWKKILVKER